MNNCWRESFITETSSVSKKAGVWELVVEARDFLTVYIRNMTMMLIHMIYMGKDPAR
jgi:tRNA U38,U39,U40 pseudouridine synthase TruA